MLKDMNKNKAYRLVKALGLMAVVGGSLYANMALAADSYVTLGTVASTIDNTVTQLSTVLIDIAIIAGIIFMIAAFFKIHQHKQNPQQVQLSQGISLLLIGAGLTLIPLLIPTASVAVLGTAAKSTAQIGGSTIHNLIGNSSSK